MNHSLRFMRSSTSALPQATLRQLEKIFRVPVIESYGMTECPSIASNPPRLRKPGSVGSPIVPDLKIVNENGVSLRSGETGEIMIHGLVLRATPGSGFGPVIPVIRMRKDIFF